MDGIGLHSSSSMGKAKGYGYLAPHTSSSSTSLGKMVRPDPAEGEFVDIFLLCVFLVCYFFNKKNKEKHAAVGDHVFTVLFVLLGCHLLFCVVFVVCVFLSLCCLLLNWMCFF